MIENRQKTGFDAALPGEGLLIWHIDESIGNNNNYLHKLVDLEEADGLNYLDSGLNRGDAGDPWYNKAVGFTQSTTPNSHFYNGSDSGVRVTNIGASGTIIEANLIVPGGSGPTITNITPSFGANTRKCKYHEPFRDKFRKRGNSKSHPEWVCKYQRHRCSCRVAHEDYLHASDHG